MLTNLPLLDEVLDHHATQLGGDFQAYRNHAYRVANFCWALAPKDGGGELLRIISLAAAFHDLGIWTDGTFDYIAPSQRLAREWLTSNSQEDSAEEIAAMICQHHKITPCHSSESPLVELFRRADWADVSRGLMTSGLSREIFREVSAEFPNAGFHRRLVQLTFGQFKRHPFNPLPMLRF